MKVATSEGKPLPRNTRSRTITPSAIAPQRTSTASRPRAVATSSRRIDASIGGSRGPDGCPMGVDQRLIPAAARLHAAALRCVVDVDEPEALARPVCPFEVVEKGPDEIALERDAGIDRVRR